MPPVEKTGRPACEQMQSEAATVVAPSAPRAIAHGMSRAETLGIPERERNRSRSASLMPACGMPRTTAVTAGSAPRSRIAARMRRSASRFDGSGSPWARTELSNATTARPSLRAAATSGWSWTFTNQLRVVELFRLLRHHQFALRARRDRTRRARGPSRQQKYRTSCPRRASQRSHDHPQSGAPRSGTRCSRIACGVSAEKSASDGCGGRGESSARNIRVQPLAALFAAFFYVTVGRDPSNCFQAPDSRIAAVSATARSTSASIV